MTRTETVVRLVCNRCNAATERYDSRETAAWNARRDGWLLLKGKA